MPDISRRSKKRKREKYPSLTFMLPLLAPHFPLFLFSPLSIQNSIRLRSHSRFLLLFFGAKCCNEDSLSPNPKHASLPFYTPYFPSREKASFQTEGKSRKSGRKKVSPFFAFSIFASIANLERCWKIAFFFRCNRRANFWNWPAKKKFPPWCYIRVSIKRVDQRQFIQHIHILNLVENILRQRTRLIYSKNAIFAGKSHFARTLSNPSLTIWKTLLVLESWRA